MVVKIKEKQTAQRLRRQGHSLNQISSALGVSKSSVSLWVRHIQLTPIQQQALSQQALRGGYKGRKTIQAKWHNHRRQFHPAIKNPRWPQRPAESFFDTWTPAMAYVLGFFAADGCMYINKRGSCYIGFSTVERENVENIKRLMQVKNAIESYQPTQPNHQMRYTLQVGSKKMYQRLLDLGFTPNKSLALKFPDMPIKLLPHFTRGYFDGDGGVHHAIYLRKNRPGKTITILQTHFTSGSKQFLKQLQKKLKIHANTSGGSLITRAPNHHVLQYAKKDSRQLRNFMYSTTTLPCLKRKRHIFEKA